MSDSPRSGSPTIESDFRDLRDARGLSFEDLNQETRVPVDVLRRFESGELLADPSFNDVYLRAFVKSYAKALGVPESRALLSFDAHRAGQYAGQLREDYTPPKTPPPPAPTTSEVDVEGAPASPERAPLPPRDARPAAPPPEASGVAPAVAALRSGGSATPSRTAPTISASRVKKPLEPSARRSFDKNWGTIGGLAFVLLAVCALAVWALVFRETGGDADADATLTAEQTEAAMADSTSQAGPTGPRLQTPITVTVEATDGGLQWFRVTQDSGERSPNWIDEGTEQVFTADTSLVIWGEGNASDTAYDFGQATLILQGMRWRPASGSAVRISLQNGQAFLDSLTAAGVSAAPAPAASGVSAAGAQPQ